jgi:hypothetical protein
MPWAKRSRARNDQEFEAKSPHQPARSDARFGAESRELRVVSVVDYASATASNVAADDIRAFAH